MVGGRTQQTILALLRNSSYLLLSNLKKPIDCFYQALSQFLLQDTRHSKHLTLSFVSGARGAFTSTMWNAWNSGGTVRRFLSSRWKPQRDSDIFADRAIKEGLRSRAAYKLEEINQRFGRFLRPGAVVVDLGASPGGFSKIAARSILLDDAIDRWHVVKDLPFEQEPYSINRTIGGQQAPRRHGKLICVDIQGMEKIPGAIFVQGDMQLGHTHNQLLHALQRKEADVVLSDMSPSTTGERETNHIRIMELAEETVRVSKAILRNGGTLCCKIFSGAEESHFRGELQKRFVRVKAFRPKASRKVSPEVYYVAQGFVPEHMAASDGLSEAQRECLTKQGVIVAA